MAIDDVAAEARESVFNATEHAKTAFSSAEHAPAVVLYNIKVELQKRAKAFAPVIGYAANDNTEDGPKINYWWDQIGPAVKGAVDHLEQTVKGYKVRRFRLGELSIAKGKPELLVNPGMVRFGVENWEGLVEDGTIPGIERKLESPEYGQLIQRYPIERMAREPADYQKTNGYFTEWDVCLGRADTHHVPHSHPPNEWIKYLGGDVRQEKFEKDTTLAYLRDALYRATPWGGLEVAGYLEGCANDAIRGTEENKYNPAAIGPMIFSDKMFLQATFFEVLSKSLSNRAPQKVKKDLLDTAQYTRNIANYMSMALAASPPVGQDQTISW